MKNIIVLGALCVAISGCTSVQVKPVPKQMTQQIKEICIHDNPAVIVHDFVPVISKRLAYHGINSKVLRSNSSKNCPFNLEYSAKQSWDAVTYLSWAELKLFQGNHMIGNAEYKLRGGGGLSLMKWQSVETKMNPVVDQLLGKVPRKTTSQTINEPSQPIVNLNGIEHVPAPTSVEQPLILQSPPPMGNQ